MKRKPFKLTEERKLELKWKTVEYLQSFGYPLNELEDAAMAPGGLMPKIKLSGSFLLEPDMVMNENNYLHSGLAMLYSIDPLTGQMKGFYIWEPKSMIVLFKEFSKILSVGDIYLQILEDSELVAMSNFCMDKIYEQHTVAYKLIQEIRTEQAERRLKQTAILLMEVKADRPAAFELSFPNLRGRLTYEQICAFIGVSRSTLGGNKG